MTQIDLEAERPNRLLDIKEVRQKFGGTRPPDPATIWRWIRAGQFPKPAHVGPNLVRWVEAEVDEHLAAKLAGREDPAVTEALQAKKDKRYRRVSAA